MRAILALDTETDGLGWSRQAWELAFVKRWPDGNTVERSWFLDIDLRRADPKALEIGGFYERHPQGIFLSTGRKSNEKAVDGAEVAALIAHWTHGATLLGAQPWFDAHILSGILHRHGIPVAWHYRMYDVGSLTAGHHHQRIGGLAACAESLGIPFPADEQHTALGDARMCMRIWDAIITEEGA